MCSGSVGRSDKILRVLKVEINSTYLWTESTIVVMNFFTCFEMEYICGQ